MKFAITQHSVDRYIERVAPVTQDEARRRLALAEKTVLTAASFGCCCVKLGCGARLALEGARIITVYPPHSKGFRPRSTRQDWRPE
jgi:hypothetical protein